MQNPFKRTYSKTEEELFEFLSYNRLFHKLSKKEMLLFFPFLHLRMYKQDEVVFFRKDPSQAIYLIREGEVTLELDIANHFENITKIQKNASFGHNALLSKTKRTYNAIVSSPFCQLYVIPQVNISNIFEHKPIIKAKMLEALSELFNENFNALFNTYRVKQGFSDLGDLFKDIAYGL